MKLILKFKDGMTVTNEFGKDLKIEGQGNLFELLAKGKEFNRNITLDTQQGVIERKFSDLYSIEIVL